MIKSYANKITKQFANNGYHKSIPQDIEKRAMMRLVQLDNATIIDDLRLPPSNNLERLIGDFKDQYSIRINQKYRICFEFKNGNAFNVLITNYH